MLLKWLFDRIVSGLGLLFLWPVLFVVAILIKVKMPGPAFFIQDRVGRDGKIFKCHKFRTMVVNHGGSSVSVAGQNRITPLGARLRHYKLDELPELWDVFIGNMSFVGPRPERPEIAAQYEQEMPAFSLRLQVKAGLTGTAQVYGRYNTEPKDKLKMDLMYINNMSPLEDLRLMFATARILFMRESTSGVADGQTTASAVEKEKSA